MSYDPRLAGRPYGASDEDGGDARRGGSVRAARERLAQQQTQRNQPDRSRIVGLPQRPNQLVSQFSAQTQRFDPPQQLQQQQQQQQQQQTLTPPDSRGNGNAFSPTPQWPLANEQDDEYDPRSGEYTRSPNRGPPPQRPPRPVSEDLPIQPTSPDDYRDSYRSDDVFSPTSATLSSRPLTTSSAASEASSLGSIPDFPVPQPPMPAVQPLPRRQPSLGPPPSARRGPSSYYTQISYVSPIAEESETRSDTIRSHHGSFASSNVFPTNDGDYYLEDGVRSDDEETITSDDGREGGHSRASDHDDKSGLVQPALVRQASLGRRTKPSLMTIKSVDSFGEKKGGPVKRKQIPDEAGAATAAGAIGGAMMAARDGIGGRGSPGATAGSLESGTGLLDPSSSSSESLNSTLKNSKPRSPLSRMLDPEKDELVSPVHPLQQGTRQTTLADRVGKRRPPRIDVDAVRDAEARGSLTSLPELIRRATRLAANLDRGKTASRLGLDFWEAGAPEKPRRSGSLSDMLAAFPPPGDATPTGTPQGRRLSKWPSSGAIGGYGGTDSALSNRKNQNRRRKCCGMPMWTFVTLFIVLLFLIAAAVVIPVVLIVIPRMRDSTSPAQQTTGNNNNNNTPPVPAPTSGGQNNNQCAGVITCQNDGVAILNADRSCNCVCINGFTGRTCGTAADDACTTTNVAGAANNATLGSGIPRLIDSAQNNFNIPLDPPGLLSIFSSLGLSCNTENALVTFNGLAARSAPILVETSLEPSRTLSNLKQRQAIGEVGNSNPQSTVPSGTASAAPSATATPTQPISSNSTAIDFARIGVLLVLQETRKLDDAANAQVAVQEFLTNDRNDDSNANTVDMGPFEMDLVNFSISFQNGTTIAAQSNTTATT